VLDPLVELARAVAHDVTIRPRHYRAVPESLAAIFEGFRVRTGTHAEWPDEAQRGAVFAPIFGDAFRTTSTDLQGAAVAFAERHVEMKPDPMADRVRDTAAAFRGHLKAMEGPASSRADGETGPVFRSAVEVFQNKAVANAFGLPPAPAGPWPLDGPFEADPAAADGAFLIEEVQRALDFSSVRPPITQHLFGLLQRVAHYGALTIAAALEDPAQWKKDDWVPALVRNAYGWQKALQSLLSYIEDKGKLLRPRLVSPFAVDDEELKSMPTEEQLRSLGPQIARAVGGGGGGHSCTYGWTIKCDTGPTCYSGFTLKCDTGPTCTSGFTLKCDTGPTCTYGWTSICDDFPKQGTARAAGGVPQAGGGMPHAVAGGMLHTAASGLGINTCNWGFTFLCDDRTGPTCTRGYTFICDTERTCTYGWTFKCDNRALS
jgi:hypothetical protein